MVEFINKDGEGMRKLTFKVLRYNKYPDRLNETRDANIYHHDVDILCKDLFGDGIKLQNVNDEFIPLFANIRPTPLGEDIDRGVYCEMQSSIRDAEHCDFHILNSGILLFARKVIYDESKQEITVYFAIGDPSKVKEGVANGGHTYSVIWDAVQAGECPDEQSVKIEILTGLDFERKPRVAVARNQAANVKTQSVINYYNQFEWFKEIVADMPYASKIAYYENEDKPIPITDCVRLMAAMNLDFFPIEGDIEDIEHPISIYNGKQRALSLYRGNIDMVKKMAPVVKDILRFSDYVHIKSREMYNKKAEGHAGGMIAVFDSMASGKQYHLPFMDKMVAYKLHDCTFYPPYAAFRQCLEIVNGKYQWKIPFTEVLAMFDEIACRMVKKTYKCAETHGGHLMEIGRDNLHWESLYILVNGALEERAKISRKKRRYVLKKPKKEII